MRSGELARRAGVSADTIRHYERLGLLKAPPRTQSGYREYPREALDRVRLIRRALAVGFSLSQLAEILRVRDRGGIPCRTVFAGAQSKLEQLDPVVAGLQRRHQDVLRLGAQKR
jgi:DNA-binding transcriptional MerR regulator